VALRPDSGPPATGDECAGRSALPHFLYPGDLVHLTRRSLFLIVDSANSVAFEVLAPATDSAVTAALEAIPTGSHFETYAPDTRLRSCYAHMYHAHGRNSD
jgi:hypothetical protein